MNFLIPIYQRSSQGTLSWVTLGGLTESCEGRSAAKMQDKLTRRLKRQIAEMTPQQAARLCAQRSMRLQRVHLQLTLKGSHRRQIAGKFPVVIEPRWTSQEDRILVCYHPLRPKEWFACSHESELTERAGLYFRLVWPELSDAALQALRSSGREVLKVIAFDAVPKPLERRLKEDSQGIWSDLEANPDKKKGGLVPLNVLPKIGVNLTPRVIEGSLATGRAREPYRTQLQRLLGGRAPRSVVLVGAPGSGKSTLLFQLVGDLLERDDYASHLNLDQVRHVWRISGRRLIAGMSQVGDWERRCGELLEEMQGRNIILYVEDVAAFARIGKSRDSERSLSDYFRGPLARNDVVMVAECTPQALARLEEEAPSFASQFVRLDVKPTTREQTYRLMFHEARALELRHEVAFSVSSYRSIVELTESLYPAAAFPGKALDVLRALARADSEITDDHVVRHLAGRTGLPRDVLRPDSAIDPSVVAARFSRRVMGQPAAVQAATDLSMRVRQGLTDPSRPFSVMLFTGPTGTGKTELAKAIAEHQYGSLSRLVRVDMSEMSGPDGPSRLIGHRFQPDGLLTRPVQEQPFCVVLLDEVEKAHPSVLNLLLQLFDEGRLTDAAGRLADFRRAVVIMTSNLGARRRAPVGFDEPPQARGQEVARAVRDFFPPELFNRIDEVVPFESLGVGAARMVADKELADLVARRGLVSRSVYVVTTKALLDRVVAEGFDPEHGARTVKRYLEDHVASLLTRVLTQDRPAQMRTLTVYSAQDGFRIHEEALRECAPASLRLPVLSAQGADRERLSADYLEAMERLRSTVEEGALQRLGRVRSDALSAMPVSADLQTLEALREAVEGALEVPSGAAREAQLWDEYDDWNGQGALPARIIEEAPLGHQGSHLNLKTAALSDIEEATSRLRRLRRELQCVGEEGRHAVRIEVRHVGPVRASSDVAGLVQAYADIKDVEIGGCACLFPDGTLAESEDRLAWAPGTRPTHVVLDLSGLGLRDRLRFETGTHGYRTLAEGGRLAVVQVGPLQPSSPAEVLRAHQHAQQAFEAALEGGQDPLPINPARLGPLVRSVEYLPSDEPSIAGMFKVEDYRLQTQVEVRTSQLGGAYAPLWQLIEGSEAP